MRKSNDDSNPTNTPKDQCPHPSYHFKGLSMVCDVCGEYIGIVTGSVVDDGVSKPQDQGLCKCFCHKYAGKEGCEHCRDVISSSSPLEPILSAPLDSKQDKPLPSDIEAQIRDILMQPYFHNGKLIARLPVADDHVAQIQTLISQRVIEELEALLDTWSTEFNESNLPTVVRNRILELREKK